MRLLKQTISFLLLVDILIIFINIVGVYNSFFTLAQFLLSITILVLFIILNRFEREDNTKS